jgi:RNA polymerase sigma-70 factor (ECF subfamily)
MPRPDESPTPELLQRFRAGDPRAAEELFTRYAQRLVRVAQRQLSKKLAGRLDGEDVVQSALRSFFRREARGDFRIDSSSELWQLLVKLTLAKARTKARHHTAQKRDVTAEVADGDALAAEAVVREPRPEEAAALVDQIDLLLHGLPELHGEVLRMRLEGQSVTELAEALQVSRQTVYRVLQVLRGRVAKMASTSEC